ncbi:hypothetical protein QW131_18350 [Roseibium salinum]|nr:hypothetical protein [Roseibium salinum]
MFWSPIISRTARSGCFFQLNGKDWLRKPLERRSFLEAINTHMNTVKAGSGFVHAVVSAGGGAGGTTVALTLAHHLARTRKRRKPRVALFDLDFAAADCGAYLNSINPYDLESALDNPKRVDTEFIDLVRNQHEAGFSLFSFFKPELLLSPRTNELVLRMLDVIAFQNDHTVLDLPYYETPWREKVISSVNSITIVTAVSIPALQSAKLLKKPYCPAARREQDGADNRQQGLWRRSVRIRARLRGNRQDLQGRQFRHHPG